MRKASVFGAKYRRPDTGAPVAGLKMVGGEGLEPPTSSV